MASRRVCVLGAGVVGLSSAVCILEQCPGLEVTLLADKFSPHTTSDVSGGFWDPYCVGDTPRNVIREWSSATWDHMYRLFDSPDAGKVGCQMLSGYILSENEQLDFDFKDQVLGYRPLTRKELNLFPFARSGVFFTSLQLDVTLYLQWLMARFKDKGGKTKQVKVCSLDEVTDKYDLVVNCTGLGSYEMLGDKSLSSVRGQVIRVNAPWVKHFTVNMDPAGNETYIIPGARDVVVGGIAQKDNWNPDVEETDSQDIHQRALSLLPSLKGAEIKSVKAGLRPLRITVRLEMEHIKRNGKPKPVIHNYGHGGAGITLHWGCAKQTTHLVTEALRKSKL